MARPTILTEDQKSFIAKLKESNPNMQVREVIGELKSYLTGQLKEKYPNLSEKEIEKLFYDEYLSESAITKYLTDLNKKINNLPNDKPWNTFILNTEPVNPDALPWLLGIQQRLKHYFAKPMTIREAKWFNRLFGFRNTIKTKDAELANNELFISNVIFTWAQIYAYREKIDFVAGIKEPDYADLDEAITNLDFEAIYKRNDYYLFKDIEATIDSIEANPDKEKAYLDRAKNTLTLLSIDLIRHIEIKYLNHSLGEPDISRDSISLYQRLLPGLDDYFGQIEALDYMKRLDLFVGLRDLCKNNAENIRQDNQILSKIFEFLKKGR